MELEDGVETGFIWMGSGWENNLKQLIDDKTLTQGRGDHWVWKADEKLIYTVNSAYKRLRMDVEGDLRSLWVFLEH